MQISLSSTFRPCLIKPLYQASVVLNKQTTNDERPSDGTNSKSEQVGNESTSGSFVHKTHMDLKSKLDEYVKNYNKDPNHDWKV